MFEHRVVYMTTRKGLPCLNFNKWFVDDNDDLHQADNQYKNITLSSWERINKILRNCESTTHGTSPTKVWVGFWFYGKV